MNDLSGKVAVITGGAGVLCSAIAEGLARVGVKTVILDIDEKKVKKPSPACGRQEAMG